MDTFAIAASGKEIRRAAEWLTGAFRQRGVPDSQVERLEVALEEVLSNVHDHGGSSARAAPITIRIEVHEKVANAEARVTVTDSGVPFDPTGVPERPRARTLAEAQPGGMGLPLIRRCSDWVDYRREGNYNHLTFGARWSRG